MLRSETAQDSARAARVLAGLRRYQEAQRTPPGEPMPVVAEAAGAMLRDYGCGRGTPVVFVPSLINPPNVLDLAPDRSLLRWLAARGHRPLLVDWGWDVARRRDLSIADHVETVLLPLIAGLDEPPALVGYCLGGTMAVAAAALTPVRSLATIATPWHFDGYPPAARSMLDSLWKQGRATAGQLGLFPMELLQSAFWSLDPARTVAKFEAFAELAEDSEQARAFVLLEDWANDGPPIGSAVARELFEDFFAEDSPGTGTWRVAGRPIAPTAIDCPLLSIVSTSDRIVPAATALTSGVRIDLALGHVGMVVGRRAQEALWQPLEDWLTPPPRP